MTIVFGIISLSREGQTFGAARLVFLLISAMQFYWMYKIVISMTGKLTTAATVKIKTK